MEALGVNHFVVCADADGSDPTPRQRQLQEIIAQSRIRSERCAVVPVEEIEAWILADIQAVRNVITGWTGDDDLDYKNPEAIKNPKEHLARTIKNKSQKPPYSPPTHNPRVAKHLNLDLVSRRCASFATFRRFVESAMK